MKRNLLLFSICLGFLPISPAFADKECVNSNFILPVHIPMQAITTQLNQVLPIKLSGTESDPVKNKLFVKDSLQWSVSRGPIKLKAHQNTLQARVQLTGSMTVSGRLKVIRGTVGKLLDKIKIGKIIEIPLRGTLERIQAHATLSIRPQLTSDWRVRPNGIAKAKVSKATGRILLNTIPFSARRQLQDKLDPELAKLIRHFNQSIANNTLIQDRVTQFWSSLHRAIQINKQPPIWLSLKPRGVSAAQPKFSEHGVDLAVGIEASTVLATGTKPSVRVTRLPELKLVPPPTVGRLNLALPVVVNWETANKAIVHQLKKEPAVIERGVGRLSIEHIDLKGIVDGKIVVTARFSVRPTGALGRVLAWIDRWFSSVGLGWRLSDTLENQIVQMTAIVRLGSAGKTVSVHQVKLTPSSSDLVRLVADVYEWIDNRTIESLIEQKALVDLSKQISDGERQAQAQIGKITDDLGKHGVRMTASVENVTRLDSLQVTPTALLTKLCAAAKVSVQVLRLDQF